MAVDTDQSRRRPALPEFRAGGSHSSDLSQCRDCHVAQTDALCGSTYRARHSIAILKSRSSMRMGYTPWCSRAGGLSMAGSRRKPGNDWTCTRPIGANGGSALARAPCASWEGPARRPCSLPRPAGAGWFAGAPRRFSRRASVGNAQRSNEPPPAPWRSLHYPYRLLNISRVGSLCEAPRGAARRRPVSPRLRQRSPAAYRCGSGCSCGRQRCCAASPAPSDVG